jgi:hypothetical protein
MLENVRIAANLKTGGAGEGSPEQTGAVLYRLWKISFKRASFILNHYKYLQKKFYKKSLSVY